MTKITRHKNDFIHKLGIAQKETDETMYWLELMVETKILSEEEFKSIHNECDEILKMIRSSILTAKKNIKMNSSLITHNS